MTKRSRTIDLRDLFYTILSKWVIILIVGIVCAGGWYAYNWYNTYHLEDEVPKDIKEELDEVYALREEYEILENSRIKDMDPEDAWFVRVSFLMPTELASSDEYSQLKSRINDDFWQKVADESDTGFTKDELLILLHGVWEYSFDDGYRYFIDICTDNYSDAEKIYNITKEIVSEYGNELIGAENWVANWDGVWQDDNTPGYWNDCLSGYYNKVDELKENYSIKENSLEGKKFLYYERDYLKQKIEMSISFITIKLISGLIIGILISVVIIILLYFFSPKVKSKAEITSDYGLYVIGTIIGKDISCIKKKQYRADSINYVKKVMGDISKKPIVICTDNKEKMNKIIGTDNNVIVAGYVQENSESLEQAVKTGKVILEVPVKKLKYEQLERELEIYKGHQIDVIGVVVTVNI